MALGIV